MFVVREVLSCKPGKVGELTRRFKIVSAVLQRLGHRPFRLLTDLSGDPFWTLIAETEAESLDAFLRIESEVMADQEARDTMSGYHELLQSGRREILRLV